MIFQRFQAVVAVVLFALSSSYATSIVDVRLSHNSLDEEDKALYVNIDVRVDNQDHMILAGQNYRIYYPSGTLSLDKSGSKSQLSAEKYTQLKFSSVLENVPALGQGGIEFDDNLGFANLSVDLLDNENGGASFSAKDGWVTMATLKFNVVADFDEVSMVWGREGMSESYATAFVEIAEWEAPLSTTTVAIDEYIDFNLAISSLALEGVAYDIVIGPNPSIDFVEIKSNQPLNADVSLAIRDLTGRLVKTRLLNKGSSVYSIDVSNLLSASYILDLSDQNGEGLLSQKIVVTQ